MLAERMKCSLLSLLSLYCLQLTVSKGQTVTISINRAYPSSPQSQVPSYILSKPNENTIHRFFDSSPISPSNQYVATTSFPLFESLSQGNTLATISITDVLKGTAEVIDQTIAWDSQVGAQVQWGTTDNELYYNTVCHGDIFSQHVESTTQNVGQFVVRGTVYNRTSRQARLLDCPIYHISPDGKYGIAPSMLKIHHTQKGYGIRPLDFQDDSMKNMQAPTDDGLYLTNTVTGQCSLLISLHRLATAAGIDVTSTPIYGFHTKFSSDGTLIMFVVRTLEQPVPPRVAPVRVQHLFVLDRTASSIRRVISWASYPFRPRHCAPHNGSTTSCPVVYLRDGNHPNWVPNSHKISMNLQKTVTKTLESTESVASSLLKEVAKIAGLHTQKRTSEWSIVKIDVDVHAENFVYQYDMEVIATSDRKGLSCAREGAQSCADKSRTTAAPASTSSLTMEIGNEAGSGHPIYHPSGKYIITDAYPKEMHVLTSSGRLTVLNGSTLLPLSVPLRLIEVETQREVWLLQMQVERAPISVHSQVKKMGEYLRSSTAASVYDFSTFKGAIKNNPKASRRAHQRDLQSAVSNAQQSNRSVAGITTSRRTIMANTSSATCSVPSLPQAQMRTPLREDKSWRCDLHPAWSRDHTFVAVNGRPDGAERQVVLLHVGADLSKYFPR